MTDTIIIGTINGVADMRLNRPKKHNAINSEVMSGLLAPIAQRNPDVIRAAKKLSNDLMTATTKEGLIAESDCSSNLMSATNQIEAVVSHLEHRNRH